MLPVTHAEMETKIPGYPAAMMTQAFANAIPRGKSYEEELIHAHILFLRDFSKVINPSLRDRGDLALLDSFQTALKAALGNRNPERNARHVTLLIHMGVLVVPGMAQPEAPAAEVTAAALAFIAVLRAARGETERHASWVGFIVQIYVH